VRESVTAIRLTRVAAEDWPDGAVCAEGIRDGRTWVKMTVPIRDGMARTIADALDQIEANCLLIPE
jgi:hypothetical protein